MGASLKVDLSKLHELANRINGPQMQSQVQKVVQDKGIYALISQAIADNFSQQGPGWKPLKPATIRQSVSQALKKAISKGKKVTRMILKGRTQILFKSVTTAGAMHNILRYEGENIIWGTNLKYAGIHNHGGIIHHPGTNKGFGIKGLKIPAHDIPMPKREFLVIREKWMAQLYSFVSKKYSEIIASTMRGN